MIYKVRAKIIEDKIGEFYLKLNDGTIKIQKPDGEEILASMERAVIDCLGFAEWYEMCLCSTPLKHERDSQYDYYFTNLTTELVRDYGGEVKGESLWRYMESRIIA